jgi:hypothetical protein
MYSPPLAIIFGIIATVVLHISKAMQRQGIEIFDQIRAKMKNEKNPVGADLKKPTIYIIGFILNQTLAIWNGVGMMFGPPALVTGMFGLGLIALMIYSAKVLKEDVTKKMYLASLLIVIGTLFIGIDGMLRPEFDLNSINLVGLFVFMAVISIIAIPLIVYSLKTNRLVGLLFGLVSGACGGMSPFFFGLGQKDGGGEGFLPVSFIGWVFVVVALLFGSAAFLTTQWGFARKADASLLVPSYNTTYIIFPVIALGLLLPGYGFSILAIIGICIIIPGLYLMQFKALEPIAIQK